MVEKYIKEFDKWNEYAKELESTNFEDYFHEREVWWCALGVNLGSEQDGRNDSFERPVLVIKKLGKDLLVILPLTSKISVYPGRFTVNVSGEQSEIILSQIRTVSSKRLLRKMGQIRINLFLIILMSVAKWFLNANLEGETPLK